MMRFEASIVGVSGSRTSRRAVLPGNFIRMDDKEQFRILFENEWTTGGKVFYIYDGGEMMQIEETLEHGEIVVCLETFTFLKTPVGEGRLVEVRFERPLFPPIDVQYMIINNDYNAADGSAIRYGEKDGKFCLR